MKRNVLGSLMVLLLVCVLAGCGTEQKNDTNSDITNQNQTQSENTNEQSTNEEIMAKQDKVVVAVPQDPDYLDPHLSAASGTTEIMFNVFEGLLKADPSGRVIPAIAKDYTISNDGLTYTFKLQQGIHFHNGKEVTMEDVAYSYKRLKGDITGEPLSEAFEEVEINVVDDETIAFQLTEVNSGFLVNFTKAVIPSGLGEEAHNKTPIGTGPYKFKGYNPSQNIVLEKFDDYRIEGIPKINEVEFRIFADSQSAFMSLLAGEVDMYPRMETENIEMLPENYYYVEGMQNMVQLMSMNNATEPLNDVKVRQAINYAIDTDFIIEAVANGKGTKLGSNMSPVMSFFYEDGLQDKYNINIEKAKHLLKDAGYEKGFELTITVPSNYDLHVKTAEVIVEQLKAVDIQASIELVEWGIWLDRVYKGRDYETTIIGLTGKLDPNNILFRYETNYPRNYMNYSNEQYDTIIAQAVKTTNEEERARLYKEAQVLLADEVPAVYIMDPNFIVALKSNLKGYQLYPLYVQDMSVMYFD